MARKNMASWDQITLKLISLKKWKLICGTFSDERFNIESLFFETCRRVRPRISFLRIGVIAGV